METVETCLHLEGLEASSAIYASKVKHSQTEVASVLGTEQASRAHEPWNEHMFSAQMYASVWNMSSKSASQGVFTQEWHGQFGSSSSSYFSYLFFGSSADRRW